MSVNTKPIYFWLLCVLLQLVIQTCNPKVDASTSNTRFDNDGMMVVNGARRFIVGSYHHPKTERPFQTLADNGYNYVQVNTVEELDAAHQNGLYTWMYTGSISPDKLEADKERIAGLIGHYKTHSALLFWEMEDEPAFTWNSTKARISPAQMQQTYDFIKSMDPDHLIITNHGPVNLISTLQQYNASSDLVACDVYPVIPQGIKPTYALYPDGLQGDLLNPYISQVGEYVDKMKKVVHDAKPVMMVLQGFSWELLKPEEERDSTMILFPTYEESRFMAYNAIVHGANGIIYWGTNYTPQPSPFMNDLNRVTKELTEMLDVLASPTVNLNTKKRYHELRYSIDTGVEWIAKEVGGKTYLIAINSDKNPVKITFSGIGQFSKMTVLKEDRTVALNNGEFTDYFNPFGVHVYELKKSE